MLFRSDRKSTRLNSSHTIISYAVFCLKKKKNDTRPCARGAVPPSPRRRSERAAVRLPPAPLPARPPSRPARPARTRLSFFFFNDTAPPEIYTLPLHDALPIYWSDVHALEELRDIDLLLVDGPATALPPRSEEHTSELQAHDKLVCRLLLS